MTRFRLATLAGLLIATGACGAPEAPASSPSEAPAPEATAPTTSSEWASRTRDTVRADIRAFDLVETVDGQEVRRGRLISHPSESRPVFDLRWLSEGGDSRLRSDGELVFFESGEGAIYSDWTEAGSVLFGREAKLLGAALDPTSFTAYGAELTTPTEGGHARLEAPLPSGGGWAMEISGETYLPRWISFQASTDGEIQKLELTPGTMEGAASDASLRPGSEEIAAARPFYAGPAPGEPAPNVSFELTDGATVSLDELGGSVVVIDFWATWCVPCRPAMKALDELYREHAEEGLEVYGLRLFDSGDASSFLSSLDISYPIGAGEPFAEPYAIGTYGLPTLYVIGRDGVVSKLIVGFSDENEAELVRAIEDALASAA